MNIGVQDGLLESKHIRAMGSAVWLFMWLIRWETKKSGLVLGGKPLTYEEMSERSGLSQRRIRRWLERLREHRYVTVSYLNFKMLRIEIMKPKKWFPKQAPLQFTDHRPKTVNSYRPKTVRGATENGQFKQSSNMREKNLKAEEVATSATPEILRAFDAIGYKTPFGSTAFQKCWAEEYPRINGGGFTEAMENTIQRCQSKRVQVPGLFFTLKRQVEKMEVEQRFKAHPL